jgi:hypothetical protein
MSAKHGLAGALALALLAGNAAKAEPPTDLPFIPPPEPIAALQGAPAAPPVEMLGGPPDLPPPSCKAQAYAPDAFLYKPRADCCGPIGGNGPVGTEIYTRAGPSFNLPTNDFGRSLRTGWEVMGGGKTLFFDPSGTRAWVLDLNLGYIYNNGFNNGAVFSHNGNAVTIRNLDRTAVGLGVGRDWFLFGPGYTGGSWAPNFRYGVDGGARWGTSHVDLNVEAQPQVYDRVQKIFGATYAGLHLDAEFPVGAATLLFGVRGEWAYNFLHLLPSQSTSLHNINVLLTAGVRY